MTSRTDWNGNQTLYVNDARGEPTSITEAAGSPVANSRETIRRLLKKTASNRGAG